MRESAIISRMNEERTIMKKIKLVLEVFFNFFRISLFTIGGGAVMIPLVMDTVVKKKKWMTQEEVVDAVAICQSLPGTIIVNNSIFIGRKVAGLPGAIAAFFGVVLPSYACIIIVMQFYDKIVENTYVLGFFKGALAGAAALIAVSCYRIGKDIIKSIPDIAIAVIGFILIIFFNASIILVIIGAAVAGLSLYFIRMKIEKKNNEEEEE